MSPISNASRAFKRLHGTRFNGGEVTGHFEVRYYSFTTRKSILVPPRLGKTLSAWIENMNRVEELGRGVAHRYYEESIFAREYWQRKQYNEFLKMTQDYAERYLEDVAEEIFWERTQIDDFEKRLREAEAIHKKVVELRNLFEKQTGKAFKDVNAASSALDQDDLLKEGKKRLEDIRQGFVDLERFWSDEISRVQTAIRKKRHLDREDARRWERFRVDLECALRPSTTHPMPPPLAVPHDRYSTSVPSPCGCSRSSPVRNRCSVGCAAIAVPDSYL
ncbi:hypothetical protein FA95DRAFT_787189 [Auriscalpium vulgare]|uniref:Uncharacterized protein n=1 Tax=Auriscalpium vulgare TaxID=40419 RepID=A0ACB8RBN2_9AGAM|nr:hypothetical protein FA95DRAFT_787189 [Auriscalpium vulgare]